MLHRFKKF
jgi:regulator of protease activity HflC (stomatin/prohibitin superfamily)